MNLTSFRPLLNILGYLLLPAVIITSCSEQKRTFVKDYPVKKPFVYENKILLTGTVSKDEKKRLLNQLDIYWDDSIKVKKAQLFGFFYKIVRPPVFDSANLTPSVQSMNSYLNSQGYYYAQFKKSYRIDTVKDQIRASVLIQVDPGKIISIDTVIYELNDSTLQSITNQSVKKQLLVQGQPYSKQIISNELDRLVNLYRRNGYYKFTREDIVAYVDTTPKALLQLTTDPFEQVNMLSAIAKEKSSNPNWEITITRRPLTDSTRLFQFKTGKFYFYPETKITDIPDSLLTQHQFKELQQEESVMRYKKGLFHFKPLKENNFLKTGNIYNEDT